ncbi:hypothetical protein MP638_003101 [Amoeboaphelidium occidentale]|nr:hypothetical protein MP638_003101 [Amoeboaphelidium occidentale]
MKRPADDKIALHLKNPASKEAGEYIRENIDSLAYKHDGSRLVQLHIKENAKIIPLFKGKHVKMSQDKYAKHITLKCLKYASNEERKVILEEIVQSGLKLLDSLVFDTAYVNYFTAAQKANVCFEVYGKEYQLQKKVLQTCGKPCALADVCANKDLAKKVCADFKGNLERLKITQKLSHPVSHRLLNEYYGLLDLEAFKEEKKPEDLSELLSTKDGLSVAWKIIYAGTAKERKTILKQLKPNLVKIFHLENGWLFLASVFSEIVDDTVLTKSLLEDLFSSLSLVSSSEKPELSKETVAFVCYLMYPRNSKYFSPSTTVFLSVSWPETSKKPLEKRVTEVMPCIQKWVQTKIKELSPECLMQFALSDVKFQAIVVKCDIKTAVIEWLKNNCSFDSKTVKALKKMILDGYANDSEFKAEIETVLNDKVSALGENEKKNCEFFLSKLKEVSKVE